MSNIFPLGTDANPGLNTKGINAATHGKPGAGLCSTRPSRTQLEQYADEAADALHKALRQVAIATNWIDTRSAVGSLLGDQSFTAGEFGIDVKGLADAVIANLGIGPGHAQALAAGLCLRASSKQRCQVQIKSPVLVCLACIFSFHFPASHCTITQSQDEKGAGCWWWNTNNPLTTTNLIRTELIMANADDTRDALASTNPNRSTPTASSSTTALPPLPDALFKALLARQASAQPAPVPPKFSRQPMLKPRRRVTVSASVTPASDDDIPWIRLCGRWLAPAGFGLHTRVRVHVAQGMLILVPEEAG